jgi:hypothetical protein
VHARPYTRGLPGEVWKNTGLWTQVKYEDAGLHWLGSGCSCMESAMKEWSFNLGVGQGPDNASIIRM